MSSDNEDIFEAADQYSRVRAKILHVLGIYPILSHTHLQASVGPQVRPTIWRPILTQLEKEGQVVITTQEHTTPWGRVQKYTKIIRTQRGSIEHAENLRSLIEEGMVHDVQ